MLNEPLLLRCYANFYAFFHDVFGVEGGVWEVLGVIQSFGFFMALAFVAAAFFLQRDLKRKEKIGLFQFHYTQEKVGERASTTELLINGVIGFLVGYKLVGLVADIEIVKLNPQDWILSAEGSLIGGLLGGALMAFARYYEKEKQKLDKPKMVKREVRPHQMIGDIVMWAAIGGILGAKVFYFFETPGNFTSFLEDPFGSFFGGLTIYGGLVGGALAVILFALRRNINPIHLADSTVPTLFLAYAVGRMGCQVAGDGDWGIVNLNAKPGWLSWLPDWAWQYQYAHNVNREGVLIPDCVEQYCYMLPEPVYPTPLYEIVMSLALFAFLWSIRTKIKAPGAMVSLYLILNGVERFAIESIRVNTKLNILGIEATQAEVIALIFIITGILGLIYTTRNYKQKLASS